MDLVIRQKSSSADTEDDWLPQLESSIRCLQEMRHKNADLWVLLTSDSSRQTGREREHQGQDLRVIHKSGHIRTNTKV